MHLIVQKLKSLRFGWNERPLGEEDFFRLCRRFSITVTEMPLTTGGFYYRMLGRDHIAIDCRLSGHQRLIVLFHELGHFLLHTPESGVTANFHGVGRKTRIEREADAFALCCIMPAGDIAEGRADTLIDDGIPAAYVAERIKIFTAFGI